MPHALERRALPRVVGERRAWYTGVDGLLGGEVAALSLGKLVEHVLSPSVTYFANLLGHIRDSISFLPEADARPRLACVGHSTRRRPIAETIRDAKHRATSKRPLKTNSLQRTSTGRSCTRRARARHP